MKPIYRGTFLSLGCVVMYSLTLSSCADGSLLPLLSRRAANYAEERVLLGEAETAYENAVAATLNAGGSEYASIQAGVRARNSVYESGIPSTVEPQNEALETVLNQIASDNMIPEVIRAVRSRDAWYGRIHAGVGVAAGVVGAGAGVGIMYGTKVPAEVERRARCKALLLDHMTASQRGDIDDMEKISSAMRDHCIPE